MYNYNFKNVTVKEYENYFIVTSNDNRIYLLTELNNINMEMLKYTNEDGRFLKIIRTKSDQYFFEYKGKKYFLLCNNNNCSSKAYIIGDLKWYKLWKDKLEDSKKKIQLIQDEKLKENYDYYYGMGKIALEYLKRSNSKSEKCKLVLSRKRVGTENCKLPNNAIFDVPEREIAELLRCYQKLNDYKSMDEQIKKVKQERYTEELILSRLIFPIEYLDNLDKGTTKGFNQNKEEYEKFIKKIYEEICIKKDTI